MDKKFKIRLPRKKKKHFKKLFKRIKQKCIYCAD